MQARVEEIHKGERPKSDLIILDDDFSLASKQLFKFSIIDWGYDEPLINTTIKHPGDLKHTHRDSNKLIELLLPAKAIYSLSCSSSIDKMDVHQSCVES